MSTTEITKKLDEYFHEKMDEFGATPRGVDYNGAESQEIRFNQLTKIIENKNKFSILDYGCGYGALYDYLITQGYQFEYYGFDLLPQMIEIAQKSHLERKNAHFIQEERKLLKCDYLIATCVFNIKFDNPDSEWTKYIETALFQMNKFTTKVFSFNLLTKYSDSEKMRPDLYYADPCYFFDFCKRNFSRNVALLHDYQIFDFTIIVRK